MSSCPICLAVKFTFSPVAIDHPFLAQSKVNGVGALELTDATKLIVSSNVKTPSSLSRITVAFNSPAIISVGIKMLLSLIFSSKYVWNDSSILSVRFVNPALISQNNMFCFPGCKSISPQICIRSV